LIEYNGNLLIDDCSAIERIHVDSLGTILTGASALRQSLIVLQDASFESQTVNNAAAEYGWKTQGKFSNCTVNFGSRSNFSNSKIPMLGESCLVLCADKDGSINSISQKLSAPLLKGHTYNFSVFLANAKHYKALPIQIKGRRRIEASYSDPLVFQVWGYSEIDDTMELLASSETIRHEAWIRYGYLLSPIESDYSHLVLSVDYDPDDNGPHNGHTLVDACSAIEEVKK
jgi:hypothetical protein